jgi:hypothetical protein
MKEANMATADKVVNISVSNMTITVQILFVGAPDYDPLTATVTVTGPNGRTDLTRQGMAIQGGAQFVNIVQQPGEYTVNVVCSDKTFGDTFPVPPATNPAVSSFIYRGAGRSATAWQAK